MLNIKKKIMDLVIIFPITYLEVWLTHKYLPVGNGELGKTFWLFLSQRAKLILR